MSKKKNAIFIGILTLLILIVLYPTVTDFSIHNPGWNGFSKLKEELKAEVIVENFANTIHSIRNSEETAVITIAYRQYSVDELEVLRNYLLQGGTLIVMDDYGEGNTILEYLKIPIIITSNAPIYDPFDNFKNKRFPRAKIAGKDEYIVLNHASAIMVSEHGIESVKILALSSPFAYLDVNNNEIWDKGEPKGPLPVAVSIKYGKGTLIVISDPSIVINSMIDFENNLEFMRDIVSEKKVFLDQTHIPKSLHEQLKDILAYAVGNYVLNPIILVGILLVLFTLISRKLIR